MPKDFCEECGLVYSVVAMTVARYRGLCDECFYKRLEEEERAADKRTVDEKMNLRALWEKKWRNQDND